MTTLQNTDAGKYALRLAALAKLVSAENTTPALAILAQLNADFADDKFDGIANGTAVAAYTQANLQSKIETNLNATITAAALASRFNTNVFLAPAFGNIVITVTGTGGGAGSGQSCLVNVNYTITGLPAPAPSSISGISKVCYNNFPENTVCSSSNQALNGQLSNVNIPTGFPGGTYSAQYSFSPVASCPADAIIATYVN